jgi:uncharacterized protein (DUF1778 family)
MSRDERFTFLVNRDERELISALAEHLQRSQSDAVRFVIVNAIRGLLDPERIETSKDSQDMGDSNVK